MRTNTTGRRAPVGLLTGPANARPHSTDAASAPSTTLGDRPSHAQAASAAVARPAQSAFTPAPETVEQTVHEVTATRNMPFLAHLVATRLRLPQTRERRRISLPEALACYEAAATLTDSAVAN